MGGIGCRHAVRDRVAVRVCSLYDRRIAVSFVDGSAEKRGMRAAELTAVHDAKKIHTKEALPRMATLLY